MAVGWLFHRTSLTYDYSFLPDEILVQIFLKLACTKFIVTCMSVCKSWYALIKSPQFINMHLSSSNIFKNEYFFCSYYDKPLYSIEYHDSKRLQKCYDLLFNNDERMELIGSCNGLICYTVKNDDDPRHDIYLWNPIIRKVKILPESKLYKKHTGYGFWFDRNTGDYNVAKVLSTTKSASAVEVYSLSNNSWDIISTSGPDLEYPRDVVHVNGSLYWLALRRNNWLIFSLDTKSGMFRESLTWPATRLFPFCVLLASEAQSHSLFVLRLECLINQHYHGLRVYDESLNELYRIDMENSINELHLIGNGNNTSEVLFQSCRDKQIVVCNIEDFKFRNFSPSTRGIFKVLPFTETLVLLDDADSGSTANYHTNRSVITKARYAISGVIRALKNAIHDVFLMLWRRSPL